MGKTWFTSDTHFGHANIIKYSKRPFSDVNEMVEMLIKNWNETVSPGDTVFHLGDFSFNDANKYLPRLNGYIILIHGNHDNDKTKKNTGFGNTYPFLEIELGNDTIVLSHYAMRVWNKCHKGALHFFGHSHGQMPGNSLSCDVGVDCWNYKPVNLEQIKKRLNTLSVFKPEDYHGR